MHGIEQGSLIQPRSYPQYGGMRHFDPAACISTTQCLSESHPGLYPHSVGGTYARALQATTVQTSLC